MTPCRVRSKARLQDDGMAAAVNVDCDGIEGTITMARAPSETWLLTSGLGRGIGFGGLHTDVGAEVGFRRAHRAVSGSGR